MTISTLRSRPRPDPTVAPGPIVLAAHGSRDPRSATTMRRLAAGVAARWPASVTAAFLDFNPPSVPRTLRGLAGSGGGAAGLPIVVPALLTSAYHGRVDLPDVLRGSGVAVRMTPVIGPQSPDEEPDPRLVSALLRRLSELDPRSWGACIQGHPTVQNATVGCPSRHLGDGLVLMAAGTSDPVARRSVDGVAASLSTALGVPCIAGYASTSSPTVAGAVEIVRAAGAARIAAGAYFLAAGRLYDAAAASARAAGVSGVAAPLGAAREIVDLVVARAELA